jgi:hypothetical protein
MGVWTKLAFEDALTIGSDFLYSFGQASQVMGKAADYMFKMSRLPYLSKEERAAYDAAHKKMVRLIREWNKIEHEREAKRQPVR